MVFDHHSTQHDPEASSKREELHQLIGSQKNPPKEGGYQHSSS